MNHKYKELTVLSENLERQSKKARSRNIVFFLIPVLGGIMLLYSSVLNRLYISYQYNVPFNKVDIFLQQKDLWRKNLSCIASTSPALISKGGLSVETTECQSGDVLLQVYKNGESYFYWVSHTNFLPKLEPNKVATANPKTYSPFVLLR